MSNSTAHISSTVDYHTNKSLKATMNEEKVSFSHNTSAIRGSITSTDFNKPLKRLKTSDSRLEERYKELFGDNNDSNIDLIGKNDKKRFRTQENASKAQVGNFVSTTVNVNIFNTPSNDIQEENIVINRTHTEKRVENTLDACNKRLRIDVSLSEDGSIVDESYSNRKTKSKNSTMMYKSRKKSSTCKRSKIAKLKEKIKRDRTKPDKSIPSPLQNENSDDDAVKELWKIFGMEPPTDRSEHIIKSYPQSLDLNGSTDRVRDLPNSLCDISQKKETATQPRNISQTYTVITNETPPVEDSINLESHSVEKSTTKTAVDDAQPVCKIAQTFSLANLNYDTDTLMDNTSNKYSNKELIVETDQIGNNSLSCTSEQSPKLSHSSSPMIEIISLSDDDEKESLMKAPLSEKGNKETKSKVGTIRVKSLGQLLDPKIAPGISLSETNKSQLPTSSGQTNSSQNIVERSIEDVFFETYKHHFDELLESKILKLGDILHLAISDYNRKQGRIRRAKQLSSTDFIHEEIERANKEFSDMMRTRGNDFAPLVDVILKLFKESSKVTMFITLFLRIFERSKEIDPENGKQISIAKELFYTMTSRLYEHSSILKGILISESDFVSQLSKVSLLLSAYYTKYPLKKSGCIQDSEIIMPNTSLNSLSQVSNKDLESTKSYNNPLEANHANSNLSNRSANQQISGGKISSLTCTNPCDDATLQISSSRKNVTNFFETSGPPNVSIVNPFESGFNSTSQHNNQGLRSTNQLQLNVTEASYVQTRMMQSLITISSILNETSNQPLIADKTSKQMTNTNSNINLKPYNMNLSPSVSHLQSELPNPMVENGPNSLLYEKDNTRQLNKKGHQSDSLLTHGLGHTLFENIHRYPGRQPLEMCNGSNQQPQPLIRFDPNNLSTVGKSNQPIVTNVEVSRGSIPTSRIDCSPSASVIQRVPSLCEEPVKTNASNPLVNQLTNKVKTLFKDACKQNNSTSANPAVKLDNTERKTSEKEASWINAQCVATPTRKVNNTARKSITQRGIHEIHPGSVHTLSSNVCPGSIGTKDSRQSDVNLHNIGNFIEKRSSTYVPFLPAPGNHISNSNYRNEATNSFSREKLVPILFDSTSKGNSPQLKVSNSPSRFKRNNSPNSLPALLQIANENVPLTNEKAALINSSFNSLQGPSNNNLERNSQTVSAISNSVRNTPDKGTIYNARQQSTNSSFTGTTAMQNQIPSGQNSSVVSSLPSAPNISVRLASATATSNKSQDYQSSQNISSLSSNHSVTLTLIPNRNGNPALNSTSLPSISTTSNSGVNQQEFVQATSSTSINECLAPLIRNMLPPPRVTIPSVNQSNQLDLPQTAVSPVESLPVSSHCHPFIRRMPISGKMKMFFGNKN